MASPAPTTTGPKDVPNSTGKFTNAVPMVRAPKLMAGDFREADFYRVVFMACPPAGTPLEALLEPEFWVHIAKQVKPLCRIEVVPEDCSYFAELMVMGANSGGVRVKVLRHEKLEIEAPEGAEDKDFKIEWGGPKSKWRVIRKSDRFMMRDGFAHKGEAQNWLADHIRAQGN